MTTQATPIALEPDEGEAMWFLGVLATVSEHLAPRGSGSPLHVHRNEDEWIYVTEGELTCWVGGQAITATAGSFVYGPRDLPHTFTVSSEQARFRLVVTTAGFESFVRAVREPARQLTTPPAATEPPDVAHMAAAAAEHGVEILGPPGIPAGTIRPAQIPNILELR